VSLVSLKSVPGDMLPNPVLILDEENNLCLEDQVAFDQSEKKILFFTFSTSEKVLFAN
jgi:hypothetical protein